MPVLADVPGNDAKRHDTHDTVVILQAEKHGDAVEKTQRVDLHTVRLQVGARDPRGSLLASLLLILVVVRHHRRRRRRHGRRSY